MMTSVVSTDRQAQHHHRYHPGDDGLVLEAQLDGQSSQHHAQEESACVTHEDLGPVEVVAQEPQTRTQQRCGQAGDQDLAVEDGQKKEEGAGYGRNAAGQPVHVVKEVDGVADADQPDKCDQNIEGGATAGTAPGYRSR